MYYCYRHTRNDNNKPFYIGISKKSKNYNTVRSEYRRAYDFNQRTKYWKHIANKGGVTVEILYESCSLEDIMAKEYEMISLYGITSEGGLLCNLIAKSKNKPTVISDELKEAMRSRMVGNQLMTGRSLSNSWRKNIAESLIGQKKTKEQIKALSVRSVGNKYAKGTMRSTETKQKIAFFRKGLRLPGKSVVCINDGRVFSSLRSAAEFYFTDSKTYQNAIARACGSGKPYKTFYFKFNN